MSIRIRNDMVNNIVNTMFYICSIGSAVGHQFLNVWMPLENGSHI